MSFFFLPVTQLVILKNWCSICFNYKIFNWNLLLLHKWITLTTWPMHDVWLFAKIICSFFIVLVLTKESWQNIIPLNSQVFQVPDKLFDSHLTHWLLNLLVPLSFSSAVTIAAGDFFYCYHTDTCRLSSTLCIIYIPLVRQLSLC